MLNITPYHLTEAVPTALFAIFALWAASSNRHWFVRTAVVGTALFVLLLVPAHDVVIQFGCVVLFMVIALAVWRKRRQRTARDESVSELDAGRVPRLSMATLMLLVVVVAVVTTVAARVPQWPLSHWMRLIGTGLAGGGVGIACVWIVCGRARWWIRLLAIPLLLFGFAVTMHVSSYVPNIVEDWAKGVYRPFGYYWDAMLKSAGWGVGFWSRAVGIGMPIMIAWVLLVRRAGWFDPFGESPPISDSTRQGDRGTTVARGAAVALFVLIALFPLAILYRLLMPPAIPKLQLPEPNGWDDLMAAGGMIDSETESNLRTWIRTNAPLPPELYRPDFVALVRRGLDREIVNPYLYHEWPEGLLLKFAPLHVAVNSYAVAAERSNDLSRQLDAYWDLLRLTDEQGRVVGDPVNNGSFQWEMMALKYYWPIRTRLSQQQCRELLTKLVDYDKRRDTWEDKWARQRIVDANAGWVTHLNLILADWSGNDPYWHGYDRYYPIVGLRLLITELAVRAYQMEHGKLPDTMDALVPEFLPAPPQDPLGTGPIIYRKMDDGYKIYSVGADGDDDGGAPTDKSWNGDVSTEVMFR